jgi:hypothetical protein
VRQIEGEGFRVMLVLSALTQVTNRLEMCIKEAVAHQELTSLQFIEETHRRLAKEVGLDASCLKGVLEKMSELAELLQGVAMIGEVSPRLLARICSYGELMSTLMAVQILKHAGVQADLLIYIYIFIYPIYIYIYIYIYIRMYVCMYVCMSVRDTWPQVNPGDRCCINVNSIFLSSCFWSVLW